MKCGAIFSGYDARDYKLVCAARDYDFPREFELKTVRVKNQKDVGSCVAHSLSSILEYYNNKQNGNPAEMSVGYIYGNRNTSDHKEPGMVMRDALEVVRKYGDVKNDFFQISSPLNFSASFFRADKYGGRNSLLPPKDTKSQYEHFL